MKENYDNPPPNFIPERPVITDINLLSKDILARLNIFGYKIEEIHEAFGPGQDLTRPNQVRATYYLLSEMVVRERTRLMNEQRRKGSLVTQDAHSSQSSNTRPSAANSVALMGQSLPCITEQQLHAQASSSSNRCSPQRATEAFRQKEYSSANALSNHLDSRRASNAGPARNQVEPSSFFNRRQQPNEGQEMRPHESDAPRRGSSALEYNRASQSAKRRPSAAEKIKEDLRSVSEWFINVTTTSSKAPTEIMGELVGALTENAVEFRQEGQYTLVCSANMNTLPSTDKNTLASCQPDGSNSEDAESEIERVRESLAGGWFKGKQSVEFQVEICQVPRAAHLYGLHFKRISGGVWNYKKVCNKILGQMSL